MNLTARLFGLDSRSLAAFRVGLGTLVVADAVERLRDVSAHYGDGGVLPRAVAGAGRWRPSLFLLDGSDAWATALLLLAVAAGIALAVGWRTRLATLVAWAILVSAQSRNVYVLYGCDTVTRISLFWSLFLPLAGHLSLDRRAGRVLAPQRTVVSPTTAIYTLQIVLIYLVTWWLKNGPSWGDGTAGWYAVQADIFTGPLGVWMRQFPGLLALSTHATMLLEVAGPLIIFWPWGTWRVRTVVIAAFWVFHASLGSMLQIGWWSWLSCLLWLGLMPGEVWDRLGWRMEDAAPRVSSWGWRAGQAFAASCFVLVLWWNAATANHRVPPVRGTGRHIALALRLDQNWNMYAPEPLLDDGWPVVELILQDGSKVDVLRGGAPLSWSKPADTGDLYTTSRWRKYFWGLWLRTSKDARPPYLNWVCETWNQDHAGDATARQATLYWMLERTPTFGTAPSPARPQRLRRQVCGHPEQGEDAAPDVEQSDAVEPT